jgi:hypothetical protein
MCPVSKNRPKEKRKAKVEKKQKSPSVDRLEAVVDALCRDDPQALLSAIGPVNPLEFRVMLADGTRLGIVGYASMLGAWGCLLDLRSDSRRYDDWRKELRGSLTAQLNRDGALMEEILDIAASNGIEKAIEFYHFLAYVVAKEAPPARRAMLMQSYEDNPYFMHGFRRAITEEEKALMGQSESILVPSSEPKPPKGAGGL